MNKRRKIIILLGAVMIVAAGMFELWPRGLKEPVYGGRKLSEWIEQAIASNSTNDEEQARIAVKAAGTNALPFLLHKYTTAKEGSFERLTDWTSRKIGINLPYKGPPWYIASRGLHLFGTNLTPALPILVGILREPDPEDRHLNVVWLMKECREHAVHYLLKVPFSTNEQSNWNLVWALAHMTETTESAIPPLLQLYQHTNEFIRMSVVQNLRTASLARPDLALPVLIKALSETNSITQGWAITHLDYMGETAKDAVPFLLPFLQSTNLKHVSCASNAIFHIDPAALPRPKK